MKKRREFALILLLISVAATLALGLWNFSQDRKQAITNHDRWAERVSRRMMTERLSSAGWLLNLQGLDRKTLKKELFTNPEIVGAYYFDVQSHEYERWILPAFENFVKNPDSRLIVTQIRATNSQSMQMGPVLLIGGSLYSTAALPIDSRHALGVVLQGQIMRTILVEESQWALLHVYAYDYENNLLFTGGAMDVIAPVVSEALSTAKSEKKSGRIHFTGTRMWKWIASYHPAPGIDGIFILTEPAVLNYAPILAFVISLLCLLRLASLPFKAAETLRRARESSDLAQFANRVENFVRSKELALQEPPYPFNELMPIVNAARWIMPQWRKAEDYPKEFGLERKLLSLLIESLPEGILFFSAQGTLQLGNELGKVFLALQQEAGKEYKMIGAVKMPRGFLEPYVEPVFTGLQQNMGKEVEVGWADGKHLYRVWVEAVDVEDVVQGFIVVIRDITFRKQWEYVQEQVLSGITHDLRGPLSAIMGYIDLLRRQLKDGPPKAVEYLALAREAGTRLTQMISDILDVVRFEQGKIEMTVKALSVDLMMERIRTIFGVTAGQKKVTLKLVMSQAGILVTGDPKLLERVLDNLIGNAIKFTPTGGTITVSATRDKTRTLFSVADTGRGIPKEAQSRIFDKFQQVRPGDRSGGYGLGLAVVKFIVEAHKGEIRVESEVDKGSTFTFWVPDLPITDESANLESTGDTATA